MQVLIMYCKHGNNRSNSAISAGRSSTWLRFKKDGSILRGGVQFHVKFVYSFNFCRI